jgi:hypothetical protein
MIEITRLLTIKEAETTKHVLCRHPYKSKFIPQLAECFFDNNVDKFKTATCFDRRDTVLDSFSVSRTAMMQACELGVNAVSIDVTAFNSLIINFKTVKYDIADLKREY